MYGNKFHSELEISAVVNNLMIFPHIVSVTSLLAEFRYNIISNMRQKSLSVALKRRLIPLQIESFKDTILAATTPACLARLSVSLGKEKNESNLNTFE